jgi:membrane-bound lytic murein transglycosylase D
MRDRFRLPRAMQKGFALSVLLMTLHFAAAQQDSGGQPKRTAADVEFARLHTGLEHTADEILHKQNSEAAKAEVAKPGKIMDAEGSAAIHEQVDTGVQMPRGRFGEIVLPILRSQGLPPELVAVIAAESGGNPLALSPKGARGLWQLMPETARRYGLVVNEVRDERLDVARSTTAAARYLSDLHAQFGSWPLALAAYNWGENNLTAAMARAHTADLEALYRRGSLPAETHNYVPAVLERWGSLASSVAVRETRPENRSFASMSQ